MILNDLEGVMAVIARYCTVCFIF